jgi:hypothetical protein
VNLEAVLREITASQSGVSHDEIREVVSVVDGWWDGVVFYDVQSAL